MDELTVIQISDITTFKEIKEDWDRLYQHDSNSTIDTSWFWIFNCISMFKHEWVVLGVMNKENSKYVAFLPLSFYRNGKLGICPLTHMIYVGKPISTYPGFLCCPEYEFDAIRILASFVAKRLNWDILHFNWTRDHRINNFVNAFPEAEFNVEIKESLTSLCLRLPDNYNDYLYNSIRKSTRSKIRSKTKVIQESPDYSLVYSSDKTIENDIEAICGLWLKRWKKEDLVKWHKKILLSYYKNKLLSLSLIWNKETIVGGLACLLDPLNRTYLSYITSYDSNYAQLSPGIVLFGESIKRAIEENYKYYDFTVGLDPYKRAFGPDLHETKNISIKRTRLKTTLMLSMTHLLKKYAI